MRINKSDFFGILEKLPTNDYKIDYKNKCNYFIYNGYKYEFYSYTQRLGYEFGIKEKWDKMKIIGT